MNRSEKNPPEGSNTTTNPSSTTTTTTTTTTNQLRRTTTTTIVLRHTSTPQFVPVLDSDPKEAFQYSVDRLRAIQRLRAKAEIHRDSALRHRHDLHRLMQARVLRRSDERFRFPGVSENACFTVGGPVGESRGGIGREGRRVREVVGWWKVGKGEREPYARL